MPHDNNAVIDKAVDRFFQNQIVPKVIESFTRIADDIIYEIEQSPRQEVDERFIPVYTGNLSDSAGVAIYAKGELILFRPNPIADMPQEYSGREEFWGRDWFDYAVMMASRQFDDNSVHLVAFVGIPYADEVNRGLLNQYEETIGYWDRATTFIIEIARQDINDTFNQ